MTMYILIPIIVVLLFLAFAFLGPPDITDESEDERTPSMLNVAKKILGTLGIFILFSVLFVGTCIPLGLPYSIGPDRADNFGGKIVGLYLITYTAIILYIAYRTKRTSLRIGSILAAVFIWAMLIFLRN